MKLTVREYVLYSLPFIVSVILAFLLDILSVLGTIYNLLLVSIFTFGIPIIIFCLPYVLYFYILQRYLKAPFKNTMIALLITVFGFVVVAIGVENFYKPVENRLYFSEKTTNLLTEQSLSLFEKETGEDGEVLKWETTSRKAVWNEAEMTSIQQRRYDIEIVPKNSANEEAQHYLFIFVHGKWVLQSEP